MVVFTSPQRPDIKTWSLITSCIVGSQSIAADLGSVGSGVEKSRFTISPQITEEKYVKCKINDKFYCSLRQRLWSIKLLPVSMLVFPGQSDIDRLGFFTSFVPSLKMTYVPSNT